MQPEQTAHLPLRLPPPGPVIDHLTRLNINIDHLESGLDSAVQRETRYWLENDTKLRAVQQGVPTYEHFRQLVAGCHLKPLDRSDDVSRIKSERAWNQATSAASAALSVHSSASVSTELSLSDIQCAYDTPQAFLRIWRRLADTDDAPDSLLCRRATLLLHQSSGLLQQVFDTGLGVSLLAELVAALQMAVCRSLSLQSSDQDDANLLLLSDPCRSDDSVVACSAGRCTGETDVDVYSGGEIEKEVTTKDRTDGPVKEAEVELKVKLGGVKGQLTGEKGVEIEKAADDGVVVQNSVVCQPGLSAEFDAEMMASVCRVLVAIGHSKQLPLAVDCLTAVELDQLRGIFDKLDVELVNWPAVEEAGEVNLTKLRRKFGLVE